MSVEPILGQIDGGECGLGVALEVGATTGHLIARITLLLIQIQLAVLYLQASMAKLGVPEWADGTAMYYRSHHPTFGSAPWLFRPAGGGPNRGSRVRR